MVRWSSSLGRRDVHERGSRELGHVAHERDELVVMRGRDGHDLGAEVADGAQHECVRALVGVGGGRERPRGADEQRRVRAVDTLLLRARHRVTANEARRRLRARLLDLGHHRPLDRADIGHHGRARVERGNHGSRDRAHRHRDDHELGADHRVGEGRRDLGDRPQLLGPDEPRLVAIEADHVDTPRREREARRSHRSDRFRRPQPARPCQAGRSSRSERAPSR